MGSEEKTTPPYKFTEIVKQWKLEGVNNQLSCWEYMEDALAAEQRVQFLLGLNLNRSNFFRPSELPQKRDQHIIDFEQY